MIKLKEGALDNKIRHHKGCNCKKSGCLKKYCECYAAGVKCSELCKCETCKNMDPNAIIKKAHSYNLLSMSLNSQENSHADCESCSKGKYIKEEDDENENYKSLLGKFTSKRVKRAPQQQIDSFNSFQSGPNMINELLQKKMKPDDSQNAFKRLNFTREESPTVDLLAKKHYGYEDVDLEMSIGIKQESSRSRANKRELSRPFNDEYEKIVVKAEQ